MRVSFCVGCTPLILSATAGHASTVQMLLDHGADIEAQSDRTKDTALSLACSGGRQEVELIDSSWNGLKAEKYDGGGAAVSTLCFVKSHSHTQF